MSALVAERIAYSYSTFPAVDEVSVAAPEPRVIGILGPNGAGKSTLVRLLAGILSPASGCVMVDGRPIDGFSRTELARRFAFVPQDAVAGFGFPVREVVAMGRTPFVGRFRPLTSEDWSIVDQAMCDVEIEDLADRRLTELSGGERQRVFLARALAQTAPFLILDEPAANLDPYHELQILDQLRSLADSGRTVLCVMHNLGHAAKFCDRLWVLKNGKLAADGSPDAVLTSALLADVFRVDGELKKDEQTGEHLLQIRGRLACENVPDAV